MPIEIGEKKTQKLKKRFQKIENNILDIIQELNQSDEISIFFYNQTRVKIIKEFENLKKITKIWSQVSISQTYDLNIKKQVRDIKALKFKTKITVNYRKLLNTNISKARKNILINEFVSTMLLGLDSGQKTLFRLISITQQIRIADKELNKLIEKDFIQGKAVYSVQKELQKKLMKNALDKKYITIINKNGETVQWQTSKYAEMLARTKLSEAQSLSTVNTALAFGSDLIQISSHNTISPQCILFEGKIFSISGLDKDFPKLTELSPFHPNCLHTSSVVFREILEERGIKKYSDFSLGKTQEHPTRKAFIPQDDLKKRLENALDSQTAKKKKQLIEKRLEKLK